MLRKWLKTTILLRNRITLNWIGSSMVEVSLSKRDIVGSNPTRFIVLYIIYIILLLLLAFNFLKNSRQSSAKIFTNMLWISTITVFFESKIGFEKSYWIKFIKWLRRERSGLDLNENKKRCAHFQWKYINQSFFLFSCFRVLWINVIKRTKLTVWKIIIVAVKMTNAMM